MKAVGLGREEIYHLRSAFAPLFAGDKAPFYAHRNGHQAKAAAAGGHRFAAAEPLPRQPADGVCIVPEILESVLLHFSEQFVCGYAGEDLLFIHWLGDGGKMEDIILYQPDSEHLSCKKSKSI